MCAHLKSQKSLYTCTPLLYSFEGVEGVEKYGYRHVRWTGEVLILLNKTYKLINNTAGVLSRLNAI